MGIVHVTEENFSQEVLQATKTVMVDFYADWCGPCKAIAPIIEELAATYAEQCTVCKLNIDNAQDLAAQYGVMSIPTVIFFKNGEAVDQFTGALPKAAIEAKLKSVL